MSIATDNLTSDLRLRERQERRRMGRYYTPATLVTLILDVTLEPEITSRAMSAEKLLALRVVDPSCGTGNFLKPAAARIARALARTNDYRDRDDADAYRDVVRNCIFGVDLDAEAVHACANGLIGNDARANDGSDLHHIRTGDALLSDGEQGFAWEVECADVFRSGGFDMVIGNPPFINAIEKHRAADLGPRLRKVFPRLGGTADLAACFLDRATTLVRAGGRIGYILPRTILGTGACKRLREDLTTALKPELIYAPDRCNWFDGAKVYACALVLGNGSTCRVSRENDLENAAWCSTKISDGNWWSAVSRATSAHSNECENPPHRGGLSNAVISADAITRSHQHASSLTLLESSPRRGKSSSDAASTGDTLADHFEIVASMTTGEAYDLVSFVSNRPNGSAQKLVTTGLIDPGKCRWGRTPCRYLKTDYTHPRIPINRRMPTTLRKRVERSRRPKLLVAGLSREVEAFLDRHGSFIGTVSTFSIFHPTNDLDELKRLLSLLHSSHTMKRFVAELGASGMRGSYLTMTKAFLKSTSWKDPRVIAQSTR